VIFCRDVTRVTVYKGFRRDNSAFCHYLRRSIGGLPKLSRAGLSLDPAFQEPEEVRIMHIASVTGTLLAGLVLSTAMADTVYRSVDDAGQVVYSDRPLDGYEPFELDVLHSSAEGIRQQRMADERLKKAAGIRESQEAEEAAAAANAQASIAEQRASNCEAAKQRSRKYNTNRKLYRPLPNGEREYLSDDELDAARAEAASTVDEWCS
jgi:hypothetical protein